ncbi:hypothetical protein Tco_0848381, partial [Tanacetum coccineum]
NREPLSEGILGATTQRDTRSYYPKRDWDVLWENGGNLARSVDLQGGRCMRVIGYKDVTRRCLEDLELKGGDGGACNVLGWLLGDVMMMQGRCLDAKKGKNARKEVPGSFHFGLGF